MDSRSEPTEADPLLPRREVRLGVDEGNQAGCHRISQPLTQWEVDELQRNYGKNEIVKSKSPTWYSIFFSALFHPFNVLLGILAAASGGMGDLDATGIMIVMVVISVLIRFVQEWKSAREAQNLKEMVSNTVTVIRNLPPASERDVDTESVSSDASLITDNHSSDGTRNFVTDILIEDVVPGDWVKLSAGDLVPADCLIIESKDLYISQSSLTGEAIPVEKFARPEMLPLGDEMMAEIPYEQPHVVFSQGSYSKQSWKLRFSDFFRKLFGLRVERLRDLNTSIKLEMDKSDLCFLGTSVVSGTAIVVVRYTGSQTFFGKMALELAKHRPNNAFQLGVRRISWIFFLTMICLVPPIFILQAFIHTGDGWYEAALFALSAAVGLTPEMLPMIVSSTLAHGAYVMSKKKCIVKNLDSIINLGGMNVLCTDKTGTLTQNRVSLSSHLDLYGKTSVLAIQLGVLNSYFQAGLNNLLDAAVVEYFRKFSKSRRNIPKIAYEFSKQGEIPFDFVRRRMSVLLKTKSEPYQNILVTKGAVDEMLTTCTYAHLGHEEHVSSTNVKDLLASITTTSTVELNPEITEKLQKMNSNLNRKGLRVIAVAFKILGENQESLQVSDEAGMTFGGFLTFEDPPKASTPSAIQTLLAHNVKVKVLTGDSPVVCQKICEDIKLPVTGIVTTTDLDGKSDDEICRLAESGTIFAKLTPLQKAQVVRALKYNDHVVGFLGDGINDANALVEADIGISVDNGTDIARDSADIILLQKDLNILVDGVVSGRQTYGNTLKYIVMAISSNFGNAFSLVIASAWFPFTPMLPIQLLTQNLLYDISQTAIPWDNMDPEFLMVPHQWSMKSVLKFMVCLGPWSSLFDVTYFSYMYFIYNITGAPGDDLALFRTCWFQIGILTQTFIVHLLRTPKVPLVQSMASKQLTAMTFVIVGIALALPWIPYASDALEFVHIPPDMYLFIFLEVLTYSLTTQIAKGIYIACFKEWF